MQTTNSGKNLIAVVAGWVAMLIVVIPCVGIIVIALWRLFFMVLRGGC